MWDCRGRKKKGGLLLGQTKKGTPQRGAIGQPKPKREEAFHAPLVRASKDLGYALEVPMAVKPQVPKKSSGGGAFENGKHERPNCAPSEAGGG